MADWAHDSLAAEVDHTLRVCELLEQQREALLGRDLARLEAVTAALEREFEQLVGLLRARAQTPPAPEAHAASSARALAHQARAARARLLALVALNQAIIGDRLAWVNALLGQVNPAAMGAGYGPAQPAPGPRSVAGRSV